MLYQCLALERGHVPLGTFYIVNEAGQTMTLQFDKHTSVGWALHQAKDNRAWATSQAAPCNYNLCIDECELTSLTKKIFRVFVGYVGAGKQRVLSWKREKQGKECNDEEDA